MVAGSDGVSPRLPLQSRERKLLGFVSNRYFAGSLCADNIWPVHSSRPRVFERWIDWYHDPHVQETETDETIGTDAFASYEAVLVEAHHLPTLIARKLIAPIHEHTSHISRLKPGLARGVDDLWSWGVPLPPTECVQARQFGTSSLNSWPAILEFARRESVVLHLPQRTAFLLWRAVSASLAPTQHEGKDGLDDRTYGVEALELLTELYPRTVPGVSSFSAAQVLELMAADTSIRMCPFVPEVRRFFDGSLRAPYARLEASKLPTTNSGDRDISVSSTALVVFTSHADSTSPQIASSVNHALRMWPKSRSLAAPVNDIDTCGSTFEFAASLIVRDALTGSLSTSRAYRRLIDLFEKSAALTE